MTYTSPMDFILETAKTDKVAAGEMLVKGLMVGDKATLKVGYPFGSALLSAIKLLDLDREQVALVASRIYREK